MADPRATVDWSLCYWLEERAVCLGLMKRALSIRLDFGISRGAKGSNSGVNREWIVDAYLKLSIGRRFVSGETVRTVITVVLLFRKRSSINWIRNHSAYYAYIRGLLQFLILSIQMPHSLLKIKLELPFNINTNKLTTYPSFSTINETLFFAS